MTIHRADRDFFSNINYWPGLVVPLWLSLDFVSAEAQRETDGRFWETALIPFSRHAFKRSGCCCQPEAVYKKREVQSLTLDLGLSLPPRHSSTVITLTDACHVSRSTAATPSAPPSGASPQHRLDRWATALRQSAGEMLCKGAALNSNVIPTMWSTMFRSWMNGRARAYRNLFVVIGDGPFGNPKP